MTSIVQKRPALRAPFRWLAGVAFAIVVMLMCLMPWVIWKRGTPVGILHGVIVLPSLLWFGHLAGHAAVRGSSPSDTYWPFASWRVFSGYLLINVLVSAFAAQLNR